MTTNGKKFVELTSAETLTDFLNANEEGGCVITFSATWCGPCKACKPRLKDEVSVKSPVPIGYVYESDLDPEFFDVFVAISAFPTFVFYRRGREVSRVEGADLEAVEAMILRETK
jgi:thiol-disulfide isomerase/thioredoxin